MDRIKNDPANYRRRDHLTLAPTIRREPQVVPVDAAAIARLLDEGAVNGYIDWSKVHAVPASAG